MKSNATIELHSGDKVIKLKEERGLLQRFVIAARSRADLDLKECIGAYEFGLIPRSLFAADGSLLLPNDKSKNLHRLGDMITNIDEIHTDPVVETCSRKIITFESMALVNAIKKSGDIETCSDLANTFVNMLINRSRGFDEVRLVFDRYVENSLIEQMRVKRTHGKSTIMYRLLSGIFF